MNDQEPEIEQQWEGWVGDESEGTCPPCGAKLEYVELEGSYGYVLRCPECGWESGIY